MSAKKLSDEQLDYLARWGSLVSFWSHTGGCLSQGFKPKKRSESDFDLFTAANVDGYLGAAHLLTGGIAWIYTRFHRNAPSVSTQWVFVSVDPAAPYSIPPPKKATRSSGGGRDSMFSKHKKRDIHCGIKKITIFALSIAELCIWIRDFTTACSPYSDS